MSESLVHRVLGSANRIPALRRILFAVFNARGRHHPAMRPHPLDISYGTTTNGMYPPWQIRSGDAADAHSTIYLGCQPSCLRAALKAIPSFQDRSFVDLGCGKGRALIVASELPFQRIVGVELSPGLAAIARSNAKIVRKKHPQRTAIEIVQGDATGMPLPEGNLVVFSYHSFGIRMVRRMLDRIEEAVAGSNREIFLIYENPVHGDVVDNRSGFSRWYCGMVPCDADELMSSTAVQTKAIPLSSGASAKARQCPRPQRQPHQSW